MFHTYKGELTDRASVLLLNNSHVMHTTLAKVTRLPNKVNLRVRVRNGD